MPTARRIFEDALGVQSVEQVTIDRQWECPATVTAALTSCVGTELTVVTIFPRDHGGIDPRPPVYGICRE